MNRWRLARAVLGLGPILLAGGCGPGLLVDGGALDAGVGDVARWDLSGAGDRVPAGADRTVADRSETDGGTAGPALGMFTVNGNGRGPVLVLATVHTPEVLDLVLEVDLGQGYRQARLFEGISETTVAPTPGGTGVGLVWDSYSDLDGVATVSLRLGYLEQGTPVPLGVLDGIEMDNDPDGERLLLAAHPSKMCPAGGIPGCPDGAGSNINNKVSVLGVAGDGTGSDSGADLEVGIGPHQVAMSPDGTLAVVVNGNDGSLSTIDLVGGVAVVQAEVVDLSAYMVNAIAFAPDGLSLFVAVGEAGNGKLIEYLVVDGVLQEVRSVELDTFPQCVAVSVRGDRVVWVRRVDNSQQRLEVADRRTLTTMGSLLFSNDWCQDIALSPTAALAAIAEGTYGSRVTLVDISDPVDPTLADAVSGLANPQHAVFHPSGRALLVSLLDDAVQPFAVSVGGELTPGTPLTSGVPLAAEMDMIERGSRAGLAAVAALSSVVLVQLTADGQASKTATIDTGDGYEFSVQGVGISR